MDIRIDFGGEVERRLPKYGKIGVIPFVLLLNSFPTILYLLYPYVVVLIFSILWYSWLGWCIYDFIKEIDTISAKIQSFLIHLPIGIPAFIFLWCLVELLKRKYPNSDDPEYLKKWNRKKKIQSII